MTRTNVADYSGQTGTPGRVASALLDLPLVIDGEHTVVELPALSLPMPGSLPALEVAGRRMVGFRREAGETSAAPARLVRALRNRREAAAGMYGPAYGPGRSSAEIRGGGWRHEVIVTPGGVQFSTCRGGGWEPRRIDPERVRRLTSELRATQFKLAAVSLREAWYESYELQDSLLRRIEAIRDELGLVKRECKTRGQVVAWSAKSQRRMQRRVASLDWSTFDVPGWSPAMVTLTYPGDWLSFVPLGGVAKRHLRAFRAWYARRTDGLDRGLWKLEFQGRGAPHFHLFLLVPDNPFLRVEGESFADECRMAWWRIISAGQPRLGPFTDEHPNPDRRHVRRHPVTGLLMVSQGVSIDLNEGARMLDPARIATYFSEHGRSGGKAYQHVVPEAWVRASEDNDEARPGRWWGYWKMDVVEYSGQLTFDDTVELRRMLRRYVAAQGVRTGLPGSPIQPRAYKRDVWRVVQSGTSIDPETGEVLAGRARRRRVTRRYRIATFSHPVPTGYLLANDAPALIRQFARYFVEAPDWPPGHPRPLP